MNSQAMGDEGMNDMMMKPMKISDAASMFRVMIKKNERPYIVGVQKYNNSLVDEWHDVILKKICNKEACIRAGSVWGEWNFFYDGKVIMSFMEAYNKNLIARPQKETVEHWVKIFTDSSIEELVKMGPTLVGHAWKMIIDEGFILKCLEKWEKVYSGSNDPLVWREKAHKNPKLWSAAYDSAFWDEEEYNDIYQKIMTVLKVLVNPQNQHK